MRNYLLTLLLGVFSLHLIGQSYWEGGVVVGATGYQGDVNPNNYPLPQATDLAYGLFLRNNFTPTWAWRVHFLRGNWTGSDIDFETFANDRRDFQFRNTLTEGTLLLEWDPFGKARFREGPYHFKTRITPYFFTGIGLGHYNLTNSFPQEQDGSIPDLVKADLDALAEQDIYFSLPAGMGIKFDLSKQTTLSFESALHYGFNDLFDGISEAGNPDARDWYWHTGVNLTIRMNKKDSDGDGIPDKMDACKFVAGVESAKGCPDRDGDGVEDDEDVCPDLAGPIEFSGCPDTDKDGIMDPVDNCPLDYGYEETNGCPDRDNDCVTDSLDVCPDIPGLVVFDGCADTDEDGIPDPKDLCPNERGLLENDGCPLLDRDCDGIIDLLDACPDIPDTIGFTGCPDLDQDGIIDSLDQCPEIPGPDSTNGCPEIAKEDKLLLDVAMREVRFRTGSAEILNSSIEILNKVVDIMQRYPSYKLSMGGYTDNVGRAVSNQMLSEKRAKACYQYLIDEGISADRMHYQGFGEANPIGNNKTRAGREMNRRVEFKLDLIQVTQEEGG